ncbi:MAG: extracellular solute-binding protein [Ruminococcaceae bacterium]|nr:extracellular solute-binding protein [Oscillospiraceae bacterium]
MKKFFAFVLALACALSLMACSGGKEQIVIYTSANDSRIAHMTGMLEEKFPDYEFIVEYQSTSKVTAKLAAEGTATECDIIHDLAYLSLAQLDGKGILADLSSYDTSVYTDDCVVSPNYLVELRTGGAIILNTKVMQEKNLPTPTCYEDLLKPEYKGLISMPDPKSSGTGYMFLKSLVNAWGEEKAFDYFKKLSENVLQFTSSGNGPVNALIQEEVAIGLGMTANAVVQINEGVPLQVLFFEEGSPYSMYGQSIIKGKEQRKCVKEVFDYLINTYTAESCRLYAPEKIYKDVDFELENFPKEVKYADMSNDTLEEKERLLAKWDV